MGKQAHIGTFTYDEGVTLAEAIRGGEEADHPDHVRWAALRMLARLKPRTGYDEGDLLRRVAIEMRKGTFDKLEVPPVCLGQIAATLRILEPFEQFYQGVLFLFERMRGAASDEMEASVADLSGTETTKEAREAVCRSAADLQTSLQTARDFNPTTAMEVETVFQESGILALAKEVLCQTTDDVELMRIILRRHAQVQSGKFDKGLPKAAWIRPADGGDRVRLTAQRHQLPASQRPKGWKDVGRHPYRTNSAFAFILACDIN